MRSSSRGTEARPRATAELVDVAAVLRRVRIRLAHAVESPGVEAEVLVGHVLGRSRASMYAHSRSVLSADEAARLEDLVARRVAGEPLQYLTGHQGFRRLDLAVGPGVLVPRPETELVVEQALRRIADVDRPAVVDVGTGSGAIALSVAVERPDARVWATEISPDALVWARLNADRVAPRVVVREGDLLAPLPGALRGALDLVVANPPYLATSQLASVAPDVRDHEPWVATVSGPTGLEVPARVVSEARAWLRPGGWLVMETWPGQADELLALLADGYEEAAVHPDLTGSLRVAEGRLG